MGSLDNTSVEYNFFIGVYILFLGCLLRAY